MLPRPFIKVLSITAEFSKGTKSLVKNLKPCQLALFQRFCSNSMYKSAVLKEFGQPLTIEMVPVESILRHDEVRIKNYACGIHILDVSICKGIWSYKPNLPFQPGFEISGVLEEVGMGVKHLNVGDRVVCFNREMSGGFAQQCIAPIKDVWKIPSGVSFSEAAALIDGYSLAYLALDRRANIQKDDVVLVTAADSVLGLAAVDLAAHVYKARVIGTCSTEIRANNIRAKGAWAALKYSKRNVIETLNELSDEKGAQIIFETVGGDTFTDMIDCVAHEGKLIVGGFASHLIPSIATSVLLPRSFALIGVSLTHYRLNANEIYREAIEDIINMAEEKFIEPSVDSTYKLEDVIG